MTTCGTDNDFQIYAKVSPGILARADRMFDGTPKGRMNELIQNARRAKATTVSVTLGNDGKVSVHDDGAGIDDFSALLDMGRSNWSRNCEAAEDPAGIGLFCLAPGHVTIASGKWSVALGEPKWRGTEPALVCENDDLVRGTRITYIDPELCREDVIACFRFCGMTAIVDGETFPPEPFIADNENPVHLPAFGVKVMFADCSDSGRIRYGDNLGLNFYGQTLSMHLDRIPPGTKALVDLTGEPTGLRLMLPARTKVIENQEWTNLTVELERQGYLYLKARGRHGLPYDRFLAAKAMGVELPEASKAFRYGLLGEQDCMSPPDIFIDREKPIGLSSCCVPKQRYDDWSDNDSVAYNAHLLAAFGRGQKTAEGFMPVHIESSMRGYSWAKLPVISSVGVVQGKVVHEGCLGCKAVELCETLEIHATVVDQGHLRRYSAKVPMAWKDENAILLNQEMQDELESNHVFYMCDAYNYDGDYWETQEHDFSVELDRFLAESVGKAEWLRQSLLSEARGRRWIAKDATGRKADVRSFTINLDTGVVIVQFAKGKPVVISPPAKKK